MYWIVSRIRLAFLKTVDWISFVLVYTFNTYTYNKITRYVTPTLHLRALDTRLGSPLEDPFNNTPKYVIQYL
jgi:hypothetical protein